MVEHLGGTGVGADSNGRGGGSGGGDDLQQGRSPHFDSFHKQGRWTLASTATRLGILEEVEVVVCISVVVVVQISTGEFP